MSSSSLPVKTKIVFFDVKDWELPYIKKLRAGYDIQTVSAGLSSENVEKYKDAEIISVFISSDLSKEIVRLLPKLKYIATRSTGYDHVDIKYCASKKITVSNVPTYGDNTVAEHAMALILALTRRLPESIDRVLKGDFFPDGLTGIDLKGKIIGVIGTGHIGKNVIQMAKGFGMKILAFDLYPDEKYASENGFMYSPLEYMLSRADIVTLHVPYNSSTHHMINRENIGKMKRGVIIVNTARGGLIETDALFDAVKTGHVGGVGLDVLEGEKFLSEEVELLYNDKCSGVDFKIALENHALARFPNVIITPHNAFNSAEALQRIIK